VTLDSIVLHTRLGAGSSGEAWTCTLRKNGGHYVIKVPHTQKLEVHHRGHESFHTLLVERISDAEAIREDYTTEFANFERLMEPRLYRERSRGLHYDSSMTDAGDAGQYLAYYDSMQALRHHHGYQHMHQLLHIQALENGTTIILSQPCDGSLSHLLSHMHSDALKPLPNKTPSSLWVHLAHQITSAMAFMFSQGFLNVDIKPDNVLYIKQDGSGGEDARYHLMVADYGMCAPVDVVLNNTHGKYGTQRFNPQPNTHIRSQDLSVFQWASTLVSLLDMSKTEGACSFPLFDDRHTIAELACEAQDELVRLLQHSSFGLFKELQMILGHSPRSAPEALVSQAMEQLSSALY
jgi:serine/threonine protein kinase